MVILSHLGSLSSMAMRVGLGLLYNESATMEHIGQKLTKLCLHTCRAKELAMIMTILALDQGTTGCLIDGLEEVLQAV
jgi:hypothetical protein